MTQTILIRCDFFPGSGVGHLKRCAVLSNALQNAGVEPVMVLDSDMPELSVDLPCAVLTSGPHNEFNAAKDADTLIVQAQEIGAETVLLDSYRVGPCWISHVKAAGLKVAVIDDLGIAAGADLSVAYTPGVTPPEGFDASQSLFCGGPSFFPTDSPVLRPDVSLAPLRAVAHAGGSGAYFPAALVYEALAETAKHRGLSITWIAPDQATRDMLQGSGWLGEEDQVLGWQKGRNDLWSDFDLVVGPASTSMFEAIMQGALPISFPISDTHFSERAVWLQLGHALHITAAERMNAEFCRSMVALALDRFADLRAVLWQRAGVLDGKGASRIATHLVTLAEGTQQPGIEGVPAAHTDQIRECVLSDAAGFLDARNSPMVRYLSTHPDHIISWPEHLRWWLDPTTERFLVADQDGRAEAYFWHRAHRVSSRDYLVGGWFPVGDRPAFTTAVRLLDWQLNYCDYHYPEHTWIATINWKNRATLALNQRYGFVEATGDTRIIIEKLFPGTTTAFSILERKV